MPTSRMSAYEALVGPEGDDRFMKEFQAAIAAPAITFRPLDKEGMQRLVDGESIEVVLGLTVEGPDGSVQ